MGVGLEVYNASGQRRFNSGDYLVRFLGSVVTGTSVGSVTDPNLSTAGSSPFFIYYPGNIGSKSGGTSAIVTISGNTISWSWNDGGNVNNRSDGVIFWGLR